MSMRYLASRVARRNNHTVHLLRTDLHEKAKGRIEVHIEHMYHHRLATKPKEA